MGGAHLFSLYTFSSRSSLLRSLTACHFRPNKRWYGSQVSKGEHSHHIVVEERAPSTAEEFKRVAEEKLKEAEEKLKEVEQGVASQTVDKTTLGDSGLDSAKNRYKQHEPGADYRRRPHDD